MAGAETGIVPAKKLPVHIQNIILTDIVDIVEAENINLRQELYRAREALDEERRLKEEAQSRETRLRNNHQVLINRLEHITGIARGRYQEHGTLMPVTPP